MLSLHSEGHPECEVHAQPSAEAISEHVTRILESAAFRGSKRSQAFLSYVVRMTLEGHADTLKERTIASEVFGRPQDVDLAEDTIVRVGAREVRRRLAQYHVSPQASQDTVHIDLLPGSYTPEFRAIAPGAKPAAVTEKREISGAKSKTRWLWPIAIAACVGLLGSALWYSLRGGATHQADLFWAPFLTAKEPTLLAVAHPIVYHASARATRRNEERNPLARGLLQQPIQLPPGELDGSDLVPVIDQYVGYGDLVAAVHLASYFAANGKQTKVRLASKLDFADLRESPTILIGAYTNRWTIELTKGLRFRFGRTADRKPSIEDSQEPGTAWALPINRQDGLSDEDYILLSRLVNSTTGNPVVLVAGLKHFGTEAGASFLVKADLLPQVLSKLPSGWNEKNLQVVLHARVYRSTPARPEVVRWHSW